MKFLSLLRHAEARNADHSQRDFDRALSDHGRKEALQTAKFIAELDPMVDHIICSSAQRTRQTAAIVQEQSDKFPEPVWSQAAYLAPTEMLQILIQNAPASAEHVLLIGHNPGIEEFVASLCNSGRGRSNLFMATGTLAHLHLQVPEWNQLEWGSGHLIAFVPPKR